MDMTMSNDCEDLQLKTQSQEFIFSWAKQELYQTEMFYLLNSSKDQNYFENFLPALSSWHVQSLVKVWQTA